MDIRDTREAKVVPSRRAITLAEQLFALQEPWRSRFLELVASRARAGNGSPSREDVAGWLENHSLYEQVHAMLTTWCRRSQT